MCRPDEGRTGKSERTGVECIMMCRKSVLPLYKYFSLKSLFSILLVACCLHWSSCSLPSDVFEKDIALPGQQWDGNFRPTISFNISPQDTVNRYNVFLVLRHTDAYNYNNIWIRGTVRQPGDTAS